MNRSSIDGSALVAKQSNDDKNQLFIDQKYQPQPFKQNTGDQFDLHEQLSFYNPDKALKDYRDEQETHKSLDAITMKSLAYDIISDQLRVQQQVQNMRDYSVGIGDPSLIAITNVNAQIAAGIHNYRDIQPYGNLNALNDQPSQDTGTREEPMNQQMQRQVTLEYGNEKQKEQVYQQDKEQITIDEIQELGNDVLLGVPPAPPLIAISRGFVVLIND
ncbi:MAG: hypothetical protein EZS28_047078 [Streblomastix strix]|uniref:Uncharacterized protein n=1 Tax=Streblomastix strix TaxID=222440 RepID=A0A5J4TFW8_9EUKA|nr:MAG: hypothetical protein EZS28_047078 [Streblomastix strix]